MLKYINIFTVLIFFAALRIVPAEGVLTIEEARSLAVENSLSLRSSSLSVQTKLLEESAVKFGLFPSISVSASVGGGYRLPAPSGTTPFSFSPSVRLSVNQPIYRGGRYKTETESAQNEMKLAQAAWESELLQIRNKCDQYYYQWLESIAQETSAELALKASTLLLEKTEAKLESGIATNTEYLNIRAEAASKKVQLQQKSRLTLLGEAQLASFLDLDALPSPDTKIFDRYERKAAALADFSPVESDRVVQKLLSEALKASPDIKRFELNNTKSTLQADLIKRQYAPTITIGLSESISLDSNFMIQNSGDITISGNLTLSMWDRASNIKAAETAIEQSRLSSEEQRRIFLLEIENLWYEVLSAARSIESSAAALEYSKELYTSIEERYALSAATLSELTDATAVVSTNSFSLISSRYQFLKALSALINGAGFESEETVWEIAGI